MLVPSATMWITFRVPSGLAAADVAFRGAFIPEPAAAWAGEAARTGIEATDVRKDLLEFIKKQGVQT